jgi:hypothetical protein
LFLFYNSSFYTWSPAFVAHAVPFWILPLKVVVTIAGWPRFDFWAR